MDEPEVQGQPGEIAVARDDALGEPVDRLCRRVLGRKDPVLDAEGHVEAFFLHLCDEGQELFLVTAGHDQFRPLTQEGARNEGTDVAGCAGQDDDLASEPVAGVTPGQGLGARRAG